MASSTSWKKIFDDYKIGEHDFSKEPFYLSAKQIKVSCQDFTGTAQKEVRILCKQDTDNQRPAVFKEHDLFILPVKNGQYVIVKGQGYLDIPEITTDPIPYTPKLDFNLETSKIGDSEMQHLDYAYAASIIRTFMDDPSLVLTIRGRKYTPKNGFDFYVGSQKINVSSVQTEVDAGYEGKDTVVLIEAKNSTTHDTVIRQLYYPYRQWKMHTNKAIYTLFFERDTKDHTYNLWQFNFENETDYNSIKFVRSAKYKLIN